MQTLKTFCKKNKLLCVILLLVVIFVCTLGMTGGISNRSVLCIDGTGKKDDASWGTDIRIASIHLNKKKLTMRDVKTRGKWTEQNGYFEAIGADASTWIKIPFRAEDDLSITFVTQEGSGYISISKDGEWIEDRNLYTSKSGYTNFTKSGEAQTSALHQILRFIALLEGLLIEYLLIYQFLRTKKVKKKANNFFIHPLLVLAGAVVLYISVETIGGNLKNPGIAAAAENVILYFSMMLIVYIATAKVSWSVAVVSVFWLGFAVANHYVTLLRGSPITPGDFYILQTAGNVAGQYSYSITKEICVALAFFVFCFAILCHLSAMADRLKLKKRMVICFLEIGLLCFITQSGVYHKSMDLWNLQSNISRYGLGANLISSIYNMQLDVPEGYSAESAEKFLETYAEEDSHFNPNVIVIMNESFADLSVVMESLDSDLYMPYYNSLEENVVKGTAVSSVIGGLTANSEYEVLTGNSMYFMQGHVPYQQHIYHNTYSMTNILKQRGYSAVAVHPYFASGYNRPNVYSYFGFDSFVDIEAFADYELVRNRYVSDKDSYEKVIEIFEQIQQTEAPAFVFNVTMQNHSDYTSGYYGEDVIRIPGMEGQYPDVEEFLTLIKESDRALPVLIDYFSQVDEPTVILFFGDHQPNLNNAFYEAALQKDSSDFSLADRQKTYEVPFFIWANYDIEEAVGIYTSLNYLSAMLFNKTGMSCTPYQNYLLELQNSIPAIARNGFMDISGNWYGPHYEIDVQNKNKLEEYWNIEYYHIFEEGVRQ